MYNVYMHSVVSRLLYFMKIYKLTNEREREREREGGRGREKEREGGRATCSTLLGCLWLAGTQFLPL